MSRYKEQYIEWEVPSWREAVDVADHMHGWLFRGQEDKEWGLTSSLERQAVDNQYPIAAIQDAEREIFDLFQRQAHHYLPQPAAENNIIEWLSIMQHHGAPTRLLDVTESFYVAAFFALENARKKSVVWAFDRYQFDRQFLFDAVGTGTKRDELARKEVNDNIWVGGNSKAIAVRPWRLNQRLIIQQGWFLCPLGSDISFEHCLCRTLGLEDGHLPTKTPVFTKESLIEMLQRTTDPLRLVKFILPPAERIPAIADLRRMNITAATLFPGLDGFARSLKFLAQIFFDGEEVTGGTPVG